MLELILVLCLAVFSAGLFLRYNWKPMSIAAVIAAAVGSGIFLAARGRLNPQICYFAGILAAAAFACCTEKRSFADFVLLFCIGGYPWGLWTAWQDGFRALCGDSVVLFVLGFFYLLHIPAVLLSYRGCSVPKEWKSELQKEKQWQSTWISGVLTVFLLISLLLAAIPTAETRYAVVKWVALTALFWAGTVIPVLLAAYGTKSEQSSAENDYYQSMRTFMNVVRSQRHDYNLHVQTVASLIQQEKWSEAREYVNALTLDTDEMNTVLPVRDPAIAALIHNYRMQAQQRGIPVMTDIRDDMSLVVTNAYETNKIIGNLLQNALDELEGQSNPGMIELGIYKRGEYCLVRVSNKVENRETFTKTQSLLFDQGFTTKQGHDGVGLSSIQALARRVGGDVTAWLEEDTVHFVASIPVRLNVEQ